MIEINTRAATGAPATERLKLPFDLRQKSRLRTTLLSGEDAWLMLPRGEILRGGDRLLGSDGRIVEVIAETEQVVHVTCSDATALAKAAYHLGNRHVPVQIGDGFLRIATDHVLEDMLRGLGATLVPMTAPFEPEAGAYGGGHRHGDEDIAGHRGRIHEYQSIALRRVQGGHD